MQELHKKTRAFSAINLATILRCVPLVKMVFDTLPFLRRLSPLGWLDKICHYFRGSTKVDTGEYLTWTQLIGHHLKHTISSQQPTQQPKSDQSVLLRAWTMLGHKDTVTHELSQAIFIGNESLLSNLTFLLHHIMQNPECLNRIRTELDTLDIGTYGSQCWRDPKVLRLPYLDAVCRESTRLSSPGWHCQPRQLPEPVDYQGNSIPPMVSPALPSLYNCTQGLT